MKYTKKGNEDQLSQDKLLLSRGGH